MCLEGGEQAGGAAPEVVCLKSRRERGKPHTPLSQDGTWLTLGLLCPGAGEGSVHPPWFFLLWLSDASHVLCQGKGAPSTAQLPGFSSFNVICFWSLLRF